MSTTVSSQLPIVKIAAGAVIILCAVGVGTMTGLIPSVSSKDKPAQTLADSEPPAEQAQPKSVGSPEPIVASKPVVNEPVRDTTQPIRQAKVVTAPVCANCGVVASINAFEVKGQATGAGAVAGALAGVIVGNQVGEGRGKKLAKVAGAAGGAYAGHQIEKNVRKTLEYRIAVRMNNGSHRTITQASSEGLSPGARVRVIDGVVVRD